jgi:hypothetical protein
MQRRSRCSSSARNVSERGADQVRPRHPPTLSRWATPRARDKRCSRMSRRYMFACGTRAPPVRRHRGVRRRSSRRTQNCSRCNHGPDGIRSRSRDEGGRVGRAMALTSWTRPAAHAARRGWLAVRASAMTRSRKPRQPTSVETRFDCIRRTSMPSRYHCRETVALATGLPSHATRPRRSARRSGCRSRFCEAGPVAPTVCKIARSRSTLTRGADSLSVTTVPVICWWPLDIMSHVFRKFSERSSSTAIAASRAAIGGAARELAVIRESSRQRVSLAPLRGRLERINEPVRTPPDAKKLRLRLRHR